MFKLPYWLMYMMDQVTEKDRSRCIHIAPKWNGFVVEAMYEHAGLIAYLPKDRYDLPAHEFFMYLPPELQKKPKLGSAFDTVEIDDSVLDIRHEGYSNREIPIQISAKHTMVGTQELNPHFTSLCRIVRERIAMLEACELFVSLGMYKKFDLSFLRKDKSKDGITPIQRMAKDVVVFDYRHPINGIQLLGVCTQLGYTVESRRPIWNAEDPTLFCLAANDGKEKLAGITYADGFGDVD